MSENIFTLVGNGPYTNLGCEAIVRGTATILDSYFKENSFIIHSNFKNKKEYLKQVRLEYDSRIIHIGRFFHRKYSFGWLSDKINEYSLPLTLKQLRFKEMLGYLKDSRAVLSIGGDNYSLDYGIPKFYIDLNDIVISKKKPMILWAASVGPFSKFPYFEKHILKKLKNVYIFARESETIDYLTSKGIKENVYRVADPAFLLNAQFPQMDKFNVVINEGGIGINLSPLLARYITNGDMKKCVEISAQIIASISSKMQRPIYLIPHVLNDGCNDYSFMRDAKTLIDSTKHDITLIPPILNASQMKWVISKMALFLGARTHSTIAALSSLVPTLSLSYSSKSIGLNKDIFETTEFCINSRDINSNVILEKLINMQQSHNSIVHDLHTKIADIKKRAMDSGKYIKQILDSK